jgi:glutaryl-CoA dehydrogenase
VTVPATRTKLAATPAELALRNNMPITRVHSQTTTPVGATAVGRRQPRDTSQPTTVPVRNGQAVLTTPVTVSPSAWLRRPTVQNSSTLMRSRANQAVPRRSCMRRDYVNPSIRWVSGRLGFMSTQTSFDRYDPLGLDASLSSDELAVRDTVRKFCAENVTPYVAEWFEAGDLPVVRELGKQFGELGLLGMHLEGYGCGGASAVHYGLACVELEAADSGVRSMVSVQGSLAMFAIWKAGSEEQKQQWLPGMAAGDLLGCFGLTEPDAGSDPSAMKTNARQDGSDWVLNGRKMWITNGSVADVAIVWANTEDGIRGFIVPTDTSGFTANTIHHKLSLRASITSELVLDDVRLPAEAMLPEAKGLRGPLSCLSEARYGIIWGSMGAARSAWQAALDYATQRTQFGRPIAGFQLTQAKLVDMAVELHKGQLLSLHLGRLKDGPGLRPEQVSFGKLNNTREALKICRTARTILGGNGISLEYPVIRHMVNLESVLTYEGTPEMHQLVLGQAFTGSDAFR